VVTLASKTDPRPEEDDLPPLNMKCASHDCERNLHCFRVTKRMALEDRGHCRYCGADLVDWTRVRRQDVSDVAHTIEALKKEYVRHHFWHKVPTQKATNHALRKGREGMREATERRIRSSVGRARAELFRDGTQTTMNDDQANMIHFAQHATASCCRACIKEWHDIPPDRALSDAEVSYLVDLVMCYVDEKLPDLKEQGIEVPPVRRTKIGDVTR